MADIILTRGPLFDGRAAIAADRWCADIRETVAREGMRRIHARLGQVLQHPTGYYESKIHTELGLEDIVITDEPVVYGPWLEGVGSRNYPNTRFKGYRTFRIVSQALDRQMGMLAEVRLIQGGYLAEMNE
jgi:hypothetical protein